jgi:hypothetical protein
VLGALVLAGCAAAQGGRVPRLATTSDRDGFKLLRPQATVEVCRGSFGAAFGVADAGILDEAFRRALTLDPEADALVDVSLRWRWRSILVYGWQCVSLRGDVVRTISTVLVPMPADHAHHDHGE